jgi:hypothetical protein
VTQKKFLKKEKKISLLKVCTQWKRKVKTGNKTKQKYTFKNGKTTFTRRRPNSKRGVALWRNREALKNNIRWKRSRSRQLLEIIQSQFESEKERAKTTSVVLRKICWYV